MRFPGHLVEVNFVSVICINKFFPLDNVARQVFFAENFLVKLLDSPIVVLQVCPIVLLNRQIYGSSLQAKWNK